MIKGGYQIIDLNQPGGVDVDVTYKKHSLWELVNTSNKPLLFSKIIGANRAFAPAAYKNPSPVYADSEKKYVYYEMGFRDAETGEPAPLPGGNVYSVTIYEDDTYNFNRP